MKSLRLFPALFALATLAQAAQTATVATLLKDGAKFDKKTVSVVGAVDKFQQRTSKAGNDYFVFRMKDAGKYVSVYGQGKLPKPPKDGDKVKVKGRFAKEKTVGTRTYKNEVEVTKRIDASFGVTPVKG